MTPEAMVGYALVAALIIIVAVFWYAWAHVARMRLVSYEDGIMSVVIMGMLRRSYVREKKWRNTENGKIVGSDSPLHRGLENTLWVAKREDARVEGLRLEIEECLKILSEGLNITGGV